MDYSKILCDISTSPPNMHTRWFRMLVFLMLLAGVRTSYAGTRQFNYFSASGAGHLQSNLTPLGDDTIVEIGAFTPGFEPTSLNRASWLANWTPMNRVVYNAAVGNFSGVARFDSNASPFTTSNKVWFWVYNLSGQWCLYSRTTWFWLDTNIFGPEPQPTALTPNNANIVVAGSVSATSPRIVCEQVTNISGPKLTYEQWAGAALAEGQRGRTTCLLYTSDAADE